ncbi:hypothetical protein NH341_06930 [Tenacibaculum sp. XPcli2-G]|uniref:hypothetical protein n=1 Tax=Tenacibaculum sp. XPcli2-G TaxID=2954503 RepID=UPI0020969311|nr:hypothetical protein [Tenacibaculum sp. XPcli2-G]MCO7185154.1 hypothetical protein [Tenacibaculum sp. XPcli2-G]
MKNKNIDCHKNDFIESWNSVEEFYSSFSDDWSSSREDAVKLIKKMRELGLDEKVRAGQSLWYFLLSRNINHGLDKEPHIQITFLGNNKMNIKSNFDGEEIRQESEVDYNGYLEKMINKLLEQEIILNQYEEEDFDSFFASLGND